MSRHDTTHESPDGYDIVADGEVQIGDLIWSRSAEAWEEVCENRLRALKLISALKVSELISVCRKR